jgi:hypothetical protein
MRKAFLLAAAVACVGLGFQLARLPSTPTWTLWQIKQALDHRDTARLRDLVDLPAVAAHALSDLDASREGGGPTLGEIAGTVLGGGKLVTVFNDPDHPLRIGAGDLIGAWWRMRESDGQAMVPLDVGQSEVTLLLGKQADGTYRVVGITPLRALLRTKAKNEPGSAQVD